MWYECLPSIGVVTACLGIAPLGCLIVNYLFANKHVRIFTSNGVRYSMISDQ